MSLLEPRPEFEIGESGMAGGVEYRIERGHKPTPPGSARPDMLLKIRAREWVAVGMDFSGLLADFHNQVEDILYPPALGKKGGRKFFEHLERARKHGWRFAAAILHSEKVLSRIEPPEPRLFDWEAEGMFTE